jgi:hypothetical protein
MKGYNRIPISFPPVIAIVLSRQAPHTARDRTNERRKEEKKEKDEERKKERTTLALTKSPNLKQSPILILSLSVNLISASLMTPVKSSFDSGTGF